MATSAMVDAYVRHLLVEEHGGELEVLDDGGYVVPVGDGVRVWVVDGNHRSRRVLVTAQVLGGVEATPELLRVLDELNAVTPYGRYFHLADGVVVEDTVLAEELQPGALFNAIGFVAWATENARGALADELGDVGHGGPYSGAEADEIDLSDRTQSLGETPAVAATRRANGAVSAAGYL